MKPQTLNISAFMQSLLAPLPEGEESVRSTRFMRQMAKDLRAAWYEQRRHTDLAMHRHRVAVYESDLRGDKTPAAIQAPLKAYFAEITRQILTPAPTLADLRWKRSMRDFGGSSAERDAAIARDEARLLGDAS